MGGRGKVVRNAAIFGHHKIINSMRRTQSIGLDIEKEGERCQKGPNPEHSKCCPEGAFRHPSVGRPIVFDYQVEANVSMIACSEAPKGYARWTLHLIADKLV